jgi:hypothetical protein
VAAWQIAEQGASGNAAFQALGNFDRGRVAGCRSGPFDADRDQLAAIAVERTNGPLPAVCAETADDCAKCLVIGNWGIKYFGGGPLMKQEVVRARGIGYVEHGTPQF